MAILQWDQTSQKFYETGVAKAVLYPQQADGTMPAGVAWNGLTAVNENPSGAEATPLYANNQKYLNLMSAEEFGFTLEAYTYPEEFAACDGSKTVAAGVTVGQQERQPFGFTYQTLIGNDTQGQAAGYKIHIVYGCQASPSGRSFQTVNESPEAVTFSWEVATTPVTASGIKPTSTLVVDSTKVAPAQLAALEAKLYGAQSTEAMLPSLSEVIALLTPAS